MKNTLKEAVIAQLGYDNETDVELISTCEDITNYGINGGYGKFVYYSDTIKFYDDNKDDILELASDMAEEFGIGTISEFVAGFGCIDLSTHELDDFFVCGDDENETTIKNGLSWFAAESVAREIADA